MRSTYLERETPEQQFLAGIAFNGTEHKIFFLNNLCRCRELDRYHMALVYCLGIDRSTREHIDRIYDFEQGLIKTECLQEGWQTSGSVRVTRLAFNLYTSAVASVDDYTNAEEQLKECREYTVEEIFCCSYAPYFWQAVKFRYPEYCDK